MADWTNSVSERKKKLSNIGQQITDYKPFKYNAEADPGYRQMAERYVQMGQLANRNAQGQAAALTGGYGNSYGAQVGNQMYQQYLTALNDQLPTLQANAQNAWAADYDRMLQLYQMMAAMGTGGGGGGSNNSAVLAAASNPVVQQVAGAAALPGIVGVQPMTTADANLYDQYKAMVEALMNAQTGSRK